jgi:hypothetical protein
MQHTFEQIAVFVKLYVMSQLAHAIDTMPAAAAAALRKLGQDLATARKRRKQSLRDWAARIQISVPTLMRLEKGDPSVSAGVYATALWLIQRHQALADAADPKEDQVALESTVAEARARGRRSSGASIG